MYNTREEVPLRGPRPEHAFIEDNVTHFTIYRIREKDSMKGIRHEPQREAKASLSSPDPKLLQMSQKLI